MIHTNILVIGSGVAGLSYTLKMAEQHPDKHIVLVTKAEELLESNSRYAQGGIAVVLDKVQDNFQKHIEDTLIAGDGMCDKKVVEFVVKEAPERFKDLLHWGARFDKASDGKFDLGKEGGHSESRIAHHKDITGYEVVRALEDEVKKMKNVSIFTNHFVIDLITEHHFKPEAELNKVDRTCFGAYILDHKTERIQRVLANVTVLASGGCGQVYQNTTNPVVATGDGIALAYRAMARIADMEFIQFHPTSLYQPEENPSFLISEAVRGFGAKLRTKSGELFMHKYDEREELASRDIVARAINSEMIESGDNYVYLDCRKLDITSFLEHFPNIYLKCKDVGIDIEKNMIPVVPAAHYLCGGIVVDEYGKSTVDRLYAIGECSRTGLHGANRLASNSLLEALVYAERAASDSVKYVSDKISVKIPQWNSEGTVRPKEHILITHNLNELKSLMSDYVAIVRSDERLERASERLKLLYKETKSLYQKTTISPQLCELRNLITVAYLIIEQSIERKENKGAFFNKDIV